MAVGAAAWTLTERDADVARVLAHLDAGGSAVLCGPAGIGKTRVLREVASARRADGWDVRLVHASPSAAAVPLLAITGLSGTPGAATPSNADTGRGADSRGAPPDDVIGQVLASLTGASQPLVIVDDAHWLDPASVAVLDHLASTGATPVVVATRREGQGLDVALRLARGDAGLRIDLEPLSASGVEHLLADVLGAPVEPASVDELYRASAGVPLVLRELVEVAIANGALRRLGAAWSLRGRPAPSPALVDLVAARVATAPVDVREVLELIAVAPNLGRLSVEKLLGPAAVRAAEEAELVTIRPDGRRQSVVAAHPVYAEVVAATMAGSRRADLAGRVADHLETHGRRRRRDVVQIAALRLDAAQPVDAELLLASLRVVADLDPDLAKRLSHAALLAGAGPTAMTHEAKALVAEGHVAEAIDRLETALELAFALDDTPDGEPPGESESICDSTSQARSFTGTYLAFVLTIHAGRKDDAIAVLARVEPRVNAAGVWHCKEIGLIIAQREARSSELIAARTALLAEATDEQRDRAHVVASNALAALVVSGSASEALVGASEAEAALARIRAAQPVSPAPARMRNFAAMAHTELGDLGAGASAVTAALDESVAAGDDQGALTATIWMGHLAMLAGDIRGAAIRFAQADGLAGALADEASQAWAIGGHAHALALLGDLDQARAEIARMAAIDDVDPILDGEFCGRSEAWVLALSGRRTDVLADLRYWAGRCRDLGQSTIEATLLHDLARLGEARTVTDRLAQLEASTDSGLVPLRYLHAAALAVGDPDLLLAAAAAMEAAGLVLLAAEATAVAAGLLEASHPRRAAMVGQTLADLLDRCSVDSLPDIVVGDVRLGRRQLTPRELEIARLAASGRPSKQIALDLGVSVRTVNNLLQRVYMKLGVANRADLADAVTRLST